MAKSKKPGLGALRRPRVERDWKTTYQLLVAMALGGAAMLAAARNALLALFERWPDAGSLAGADPREVARVLEPLGLAAQQADAAISLAAAIHERFGGEVPGTADEIATLPGVDRTVANVVVRRALGVLPGPSAPVEEDDPRSTSRIDASALPHDWAAALGPTLAELDLASILARVAAERATGAVFPAPDDVFAAFHHTPFAATKVVILGQDPYPTPGLAHGLAFSVKRGVKLPLSLANMFHEMIADVGGEFPEHGSLVPWAKQGVLLLNTVLTVRASEPNSHKLFGWRRLADAVIRALDEREEHVVFALWGNQAREKARLVTSGRHTIIEGAHPSPMSVKAWRGSRPYSKINAALRANGQPEIHWGLG